jgi:hypothetical protein
MKPLPTVRKLLYRQISPLPASALVLIVAIVIVSALIGFITYRYLTDTQSHRSHIYQAKIAECHEKPYVVIDPKFSIPMDYSRQAVGPSDPGYASALHAALMPHRSYAFLCKSEAAPPAF